MNSICVMREIYKALATYESEFEAAYGVCLNQAMALCALNCAQCKLSSTEVADNTSMSPSHTSKVLKAIEDKGLIKRTLGKDDKRQMYFSLTSKGKTCLAKIDSKQIEIPDLLKPIFAKGCAQITDK